MFQRRVGFALLATLIFLPPAPAAPPKTPQEVTIQSKRDGDRATVTITGTVEGMRVRLSGEKLDTVTVEVEYNFPDGTLVDVRNVKFLWVKGFVLQTKNLGERSFVTSDRYRYILVKGTPPSPAKNVRLTGNLEWSHGDPFYFHESGPARRIWIRTKYSNP